MEATFDGQDYLIKFKDRRELASFHLDGGRLEVQLKEHWKGDDLDKLIIFKIESNNGPDGIELKYFPENVSWENIERVNIKINERAYWLVCSRGRFGTRYNGSDKIEIINEEKL